MIRRYCPDQISSQIKGMRAFKNMSGAAFDVPEPLAQRVEDIFVDLIEERRVEFSFGRAKELPEFKDDE
jgi:hypothetical protein